MFRLTAAEQAEVVANCDHRRGSSAFPVDRLLAQEPTRDELLETLRITLTEALAMNRADALNAAGTVYEELSIAV
jgi:hypothetical protein